MSSDTASASSSSNSTRPRGRGKSRGGLGKYLRARGRGGGGGRPAVWRERLVLEDEELVEVDPESEEYKDFQSKFSRRQLTSNADRYAEPEPVLNSDGEVEKEPEVDLSEFLAKQRLEEDELNGPAMKALVKEEQDDDDVDWSLAATSKKAGDKVKPVKGKIQIIEWDDSLERLKQEKESADASRDLKARFRAKVEKQRVRPTRTTAIPKTKNRNEEKYEVAPPLPTDAPEAPKSDREQMEDFLDDLLN